MFLIYLELFGQILLDEKYYVSLLLKIWRFPKSVIIVIFGQNHSNAFSMTQRYAKLDIPTFWVVFEYVVKMDRT